MPFHLGYELPEPRKTELNSAIAALTEEEFRIITSQIRKNSSVIHELIRKIDLFMNMEKIPNQENFILEIRSRLELLMRENDTFREVLWKHFQAQEGLESGGKEIE